MKKQLILLLDMEGASGIFEHNYKAMVHGTKEWRDYGRKCLTSDVLAVCEAAEEFGIDEILIYDGHFAGNAESNLLLSELPENARLFDTPDRCFFWRRIRGQAQWNPYGVITVGQHARYGIENAYFPHTIQSPPLKDYTVNGIPIAEIGTAVLNFCGVKYIANIGCRASMEEALAICDTVTTISVKDKAAGWEPDIDTTHKIIKSKVIEALRDKDNKKEIMLKAPYTFSLSVLEGYHFVPPSDITWKGEFTEEQAVWQAPDIEIGLEIFNYVRNCIKER